MPTPAELLANDITEHRDVYHLFKHRGPGGGDWVLMKHGADRATKRGSKSEVFRRANDLLDDPRPGGTGALAVFKWDIVQVQGHPTHRLRKIMVGEHMGAGRVGVNESKFSVR